MSATSPSHEQTTRRVSRVSRGAPRHWVGDGFPVRTLFSYPETGVELSPFLLLDYGGPAVFEPTTERRGVGPHPHRGFETVTIVYDGEVEHRDSAGGGGLVKAGDVQWMTAASGLVHEEYHGPDYARRGGAFEMVQLWVNLPAAKKSVAPRYQHLTSARFPVHALEGGAGRARVVAGSFGSAVGPAETHTPLDVVDLDLAADRRLAFPVADGRTAALVVLRGAAKLENGERLAEAELAIFERTGSAITIDTLAPTRALLLTGEPIEEPIAGGGPFVMNTPDEVRRAYADYHAGRMGRLT